VKKIRARTKILANSKVAQDSSTRAAAHTRRWLLFYYYFPQQTSYTILAGHQFINIIARGPYAQAACRRLGLHFLSAHGDVGIKSSLLLLLLAAF
jgi:hypothetical protein